MPKKPNADIRASLRDTAAALRDLAATLDAEADALHNALPKKPRAEPIPSGITRAVVIAVKAFAAAGVSVSDIAARYTFNQGRVTDILNGKYDHAR